LYVSTRAVQLKAAVVSGTTGVADAEGTGVAEADELETVPDAVAAAEETVLPVGSGAMLAVDGSTAVALSWRSASSGDAPAWYSCSASSSEAATTRIVGEGLRR
jgi:hypothetical protein